MGVNTLAHLGVIQSPVPAPGASACAVPLNLPTSSGKERKRVALDTTLKTHLRVNKRAAVKWRAGGRTLWSMVE